PLLNALVPIDPFFHEVDNGALRFLVELRAVGGLEFAQVSRRLYHGNLHAEAYAEIGYLILPRVGDSVYLPLDPPRSEPAGDEDAVYVGEMARRVLLQVLGIDVADVHFGVVCDAPV